MMAATNNQRSDGESESLLDVIRRAFTEFLWLPTVVILCFLGLAAGTYLLDRVGWSWLQPVNDFLRARIFTDVQATSQLLGTIASGLMTVTSVTISILLLALQQSATAMTTEIFDQFLRRRHNQFYFGFFVGLALYALITLATVNDPFNPVISAMVAFCLTVVALFLLIVLLYTTINQMRPAEIVNTIHQHTLAARRRQLALLAQTRRHSHYVGGVRHAVKAERRGMVTAINADALKKVIDKTGVPVEVVVKAPIGLYVAFHDEIAIVHAPTDEIAAAVGQAVRSAIVLERQRDITRDPGYGIEQLTTIAWSSISSAKSDLAPGLLTIYSLRDILARWSAEEKTEAQETDGAPAPIVYQDHTFVQLMNALESLAVVSSESMQHQIFAEVLRTFAYLFEQLPAAQQQHAEGILCRLLSALGDHVLTNELDQALSTLVSVLQQQQRSETAATVAAAQTQFRHSIGVLHSRTTRAIEGKKRDEGEAEDAATEGESAAAAVESPRFLA
ncbi:MAG: DUF2254 family protein [Caldilineaceae bacterium]